MAPGRPPLACGGSWHVPCPLHPSKPTLHLCLCRLLPFLGFGFHHSKNEGFSLDGISGLSLLRPSRIRELCPSPTEWLRGLSSKPALAFPRLQCQPGSLSFGIISYKAQREKNLACADAAVNGTTQKKYSSQRLAHSKHFINGNSCY